MQILLNQGINPIRDMSFILCIWCLMAIILTSSFSGLFYSSMIKRNTHSINDFEELIKSNLSIYTTNNTLLYYMVRGNDISPKIRQLKSIIKFIGRNGVI